MTDAIAPFQQYLSAKLEAAVTTAKPSSAFAPSITISRDAGARAVSVGEKLADHLKRASAFQDPHWTLFDQNLVKTIVDDNHLPPEVEEQMPEDRVPLISDVVREVFKAKPSDWSLFDHSVHTIRKVCRLGHAIVVGRGGNFVTADLTNTFRIRLVGSVEQRRKHLQRKFGLSEEAADDYIRDKDGARKRYVKTHLHEDVADTTSYHLTINTDELSDESVVAIITYALEEWAAGQARLVNAEDAQTA